MHTKTFSTDKSFKRPVLSKPKAWNHQDDLKTLKGKQVAVFILNCPEIIGLLLDADQFTLKILENTSQSVVTYFKHALVSYRAV